MPPRSLKPLACVFIALAGLFAALSLRRSQRHASQRLLPPDADVVRISVARESEETVLERTGGNWRLAAPFKTSADRHAAAALAISLQEARVLRRFAADEERKALYLLNGPALLRLEIRLADGARPLKLALGRKGAHPREVFAWHEGSEEILLLRGLSRETADRPASDFADRVVCSVEPSALIRLRLEGRLGEASYRKIEERWFSQSGRATPDSLQAILDGLTRLEADAVAPAESLHPLALKGLDAPLRRLRLEYEDTAAPPSYRRELVLEIGPLMPGFKHPLRVSQRPGLVFTAAPWKVKALLASPGP